MHLRESGKHRAMKQKLAKLLSLPGRQTRRQFLKRSAGSALTMLAMTQGCRAMPTTPATTASSDIPLSDTESATEILPHADFTLEGLRIAFSTQSEALDPATISTNTGIQTVLTIYEGLAYIDQAMTAKPLLAESWETSEDLLTWTFTLRQDVTFHHGTPFTANDVVYTFERILDPATGSPLRNVLNFIAAIEAIDDGTESGAVRFTLNTANVDLPLICSAPQALIIAHDYDDTQLTFSPSGTGPFRLVESIPEVRYSFVRNDLYWAKNGPAIDELHYFLLPSFETSRKALEAGEIDILIDIETDAAAELAENEAITIAASPSGSYLTVVMQATETPFTDVRVRQALKHCLDRTEIQKRVLGGHGEIGMDHPVPSISPFYAGISDLVQDVDTARQLLIEAGYPDGITLDLITAAANPGMVELAHLIQEMTVAAGFNIRATEVPADVYWSSYWMQVPFHIGSWNFRPSIDETFAIAFHSNSVWNESRWANEIFDGLIEQARGEVDATQRKAHYEQAQQLLMEEGAVIIPFFRPVLTAVRQRVTNFSTDPNGRLDIRNIGLTE